MGVAGVHWWDAWHFTPEEFSAVYQARLKYDAIAERGQWERARWQTTTMVQMQMGRGKALRYDSLIKFPWERARVVMTMQQRSGMTQEDWNIRIAKLAAAPSPKKK